MPEGRCPDVPDLRDGFPTLLRPLRSCGATAGLEEGDTHRPRLPVWASCRMRCNCLFIILGPGWGGVEGSPWGVEAGSPWPSLLPRALRPGWVGGALASWAAALLWLALALALSSPAHDSAPGPQVTPLSKFGVSLGRGFRAPTTPRPVAWRVSVGLSLCGTADRVRDPPSCTLPRCGGGWREAGKPLQPPLPWI